MDVVEQVDAPVTFFKRKSKAKSNIRKRAATPPPAASDSDSSDYASSEDENGRRVKRRKQNGAVVTASSRDARNGKAELGTTAFEANRSATITSTNDATKQSNWFDEDKDGKVIERKEPIIPEERDGTYRGASNYQTFIQKNPNAPTKQMGPIKAPTNIRTITVTDFAPDVCKDYKQTGFCGFGDNCKFLHAREDYKQGWELDKDWEINTKGKKIGGTTVASANRTKGGDDDEEDEDATLENIPFACIVCKKPYTNPIVTKCGHYFCEACALKSYRKNPSCPACGSGTGGVFNGAKNLKKLLDRKRERARQRKEKEREEGGEVSSDEEEGEDS
jgi:RING finger protein 113A